MNKCGPTGRRKYAFPDPCANVFFLLSSDIRSEGSIAIVKKFDLDFFNDFWLYITPTV